MVERIELPRDDAPHVSAPIEWWYWTGHLQSADARRFGFHLVFFRTFHRGVARCLAHHSVLDVSSGVQHQACVELRRGIRFTAAGFRMDMDGCCALGGDGHDEILAATPVSGLALQLRATRPPTLHHDAGYMAYDVGGDTWYYSRTRMEARGTLRLHGEERAIQGTAWFDHQWGRLGPVTNLGWTWFGIQLDDGRDIMLFLRQRPGMADATGGTISDGEGRGRCLDGERVDVEVLGWWRSPHSGRTYPCGWRIKVDGMELVVEPIIEDQEVRAGSACYWEGAARVWGSGAGRAYVELVGR